MSATELLDTIGSVKESIKKSIINKGREVDGNIDTYADEIRQIKVNGETPVIPPGTRFRAGKSYPTLDTSGITDMYRMFNRNWDLEYAPEMDTSNVTNMNYMFDNATIKGLPLYDTSNVTSMVGMFNDCYWLEEVPPLNTSNVTDMSHMFWHCNKLGKIPPLDTSKVTETNHMFPLDGVLCEIPLLEASTWAYGLLPLPPNLVDVGGFRGFRWGLDFTKCKYLTVKSMENIIIHMGKYSYSSVYSNGIGFNERVLGWLSEEYIKMAIDKGYVIYSDDPYVE